MRLHFPPNGERSSRNLKKENDRVSLIEMNDSIAQVTEGIEAISFSERPRACGLVSLVPESVHGVVRKEIEQKNRTEFFKILQSIRERRKKVESCGTHYRDDVRDSFSGLLQCSKEDQFPSQLDILRKFVFPTCDEMKSFVKVFALAMADLFAPLRPNVQDAYLITGIRGVGKTELMKVLALLTELVFESEVRVRYVNFEEVPNSSLGDIRKELEELHQTGNKFVVFADEFQALYQSQKEQNAREIVRWFLILGKYSSAVPIISGSSANVAALVFRQFERIGLSPVAYPGFSDLNHGVYRDFRLLPIRNRELMNSVSCSLTSRLGGRHDQLDPDQLIMVSGGVMRSLVAFLEKDEECRNRNVEYDFLSVLRKDSDFFKVMEALARANPKPRSIPWNGVPEMKVSHEKKYLWLDRGFIYSEGSTFTPLFEWHLDILEEKVKDMTHLEYASVSILMNGYEGAGSIGAIGEGYLRKRIPSLLLYPVFSKFEVVNQPISVATNRKLALQRNPDVAFLVPTKVNDHDVVLADLNGKITKFAQDKGADALVVDAEEKVLYLIQIKLGKDGTSFKGSDIYEIVQKLENALKVVLPYVSDIDAWSVQFILWTNKGVRSDVAEPHNVSYERYTIACHFEVADAQIL